MDAKTYRAGTIGRRNIQKVDFSLCRIFKPIIFGYTPQNISFADEKNFVACIVKRFSDGYMNLIDHNGNLLLDKWYPEIAINHGFYYPSANYRTGYGKVKREDGLVNIICEDGRILCKEWFSRVIFYEDGLCKVVRTDGNCNFMKLNGKFLQNEWFPESYTQQYIKKYGRTFQQYYYD